MGKIGGLSGLPNKSGREDEQMLGRAAVWAVIALVLTGVATAFLLFRASQPSLSRNEAVTAELGASVPKVEFRDVTERAGIRFVHTSGAYGDKLLPETMGGGCAIFDYDSDRDQDILFVNAMPWPWKEKTSRSSLVLYANDGSGMFSDVTASVDLQLNIYGMGVAVGDYDNDGYPDLLITGLGGNHLFHNEGGTRFRNVTESAGLTASALDWGTSACWFDYDNDADLDLFICNYVQWSREIDFQVDYKLPGIGRAYGPPMNFPGSFPVLYRNEGQGKFTDVSAHSGIQMRNKVTGQPLAKSLGVAPVDLDSDGWMDLVVANDTVQNFVFHNERNGTFKEMGELSGAAFDNYGKVRGAMGIDAARVDEGNSLAISIGNFANEMTAFYVAQRNSMTFTDEAIPHGIGLASRPYLTFGVFFFDYDLDGWLDLLTANGHIESDIERIQPGQEYRQPPQLFWNARGRNRNGGFINVPPGKAGSDLFQPMVGRGSAYGDIDGDGDLDVLLTQIDGPPRLLRNELKSESNWLRLKLVGKRCNRDAIGAWVKARSGDMVSWRQVMPTRGYLSQSELPITMGLGQTGRLDELMVIWPGQVTQRVDRVELGRPIVVEQPH